jgi:hypothetical protein
LAHGYWKFKELSWDASKQIACTEMKELSVFLEGEIKGMLMVAHLFLK